jgi:hypothetical protein
MIPKEPIFLVRRRTLTSDQFEFSIENSFDACIHQLKHLETRLEDKILIDRSGFRSTSATIQQFEDYAEIEFRYRGTMIKGTFHPLDANTTLFVGISRLEIQFEEPYFYLGMLAIIFTASIPGLLLINNGGIWLILFVLGLAAIPFSETRLEIQRSVQILAEVVKPIWWK